MGLSDNNIIAKAIEFIKKRIDDLQSSTNTAMDEKVTGPASAGNENVPLFNGNTGKIVKDSGFAFGSFPTEATGQEIITKEQARAELMQTALDTIESQLSMKADTSTVNNALALKADVSAVNNLIDDTSGDGDTTKVWSADKTNKVIYGEVFVPSYTSESTQSKKYFETLLEIGESYIIHTESNSMYLNLYVNYNINIDYGDDTYGFDTQEDSYGGIYEGREIVLRSSSDTDGSGHTRTWTISEIRFQYSAYAPLNIPTITFQKETPSIKAAINSEAWAIGKRNGYNVSSSDETYHNNAKYYAEQCMNNSTGLPSKADKANPVLTGSLTLDDVTITSSQLQALIALINSNS